MAPGHKKIRISTSMFSTTRCVTPTWSIFAGGKNWDDRIIYPSPSGCFEKELTLIMQI